MPTVSKKNAKPWSILTTMECQNKLNSLLIRFLRKNQMTFLDTWYVVWLILCFSVLWLPRLSACTRTTPEKFENLPPFYRLGLPPTLNRINKIKKENLSENSLYKADKFWKHRQNFKWVIINDTIINNYYSSNPKGLWVNSPCGQSPNGISIQRSWGGDE